MIEVKKLVKRFGLKTVLRGVDFQVLPGEFVALLGPNGAFKRHEGELAEIIKERAVVKETVK